MTCELLDPASLQGEFLNFGLLGGGKQGFQQAPTSDSFIIEGIGAVGTVQNERKLGYYEVVLSGHMVPQFAPWVRSSKSCFSWKRADWNPFH